MQFQPVNSYKVFLLLQDYAPSVKSIKFFCIQFNNFKYMDQHGQKNKRP